MSFTICPLCRGEISHGQLRVSWFTSEPSASGATMQSDRGAVHLECLAKPHDPVQLFPCPVCQAKPGEPCTQPTDTGRSDVRWVHSARQQGALT